MEQMPLDLARIHEMVKSDLPPSTQRLVFSLAHRLAREGFSQEDVEIVVKDYLRRRGAIRNAHAYYSPKGSNLSYVLALAKGGECKTKHVGRVRQNEATPLFSAGAKALGMEKR